jgi:hypothetical protein
MKEVDFARSPSKGSGPPKSVGAPDSLRRSTLRLGFPPSYVIVGVYRLLSDKALFLPVWYLCRSGFLKGAAVGGVWVCDRTSVLAVNGSAKLTLPLRAAVIPDLFNSAGAYQNLLDKVCEALCCNPCTPLSALLPPYPLAPQRSLATRMTPS